METFSKVGSLVTSDSFMLDGVESVSNRQSATLEAALVSRSLVDGNSDVTVSLAPPKPLTDSQKAAAQLTLQWLKADFSHLANDKSPLINPKTLAKDIAALLPGVLLIQLLGSKVREDSVKSAMEQQQAMSRLREADFKEGQKKLDEAQKAQEKSEKLGGVFKWLSYIATAITIAVAILTLPSPMAVMMLVGAVAGIVEMVTADEKGGGILTKATAAVLNVVLPKDIAEKVAPFVLAVAMIAMTMGRSVVSTAGKALTLARNAITPIIKNIAAQLPKIAKLASQAGDTLKTLNQGIQAAKAAVTSSAAASKVATLATNITNKVDDIVHASQNMGAAALQKAGLNINEIYTVKDTVQIVFKFTLGTTELAKASVQTGAAVETYKALDSMADTEKLKALRQALDAFMEQLREFMADISKAGESLFTMINEILNSKFNTLENIASFNKG